MRRGRCDLPPLELAPGPRTRLTEASASALFLLESLAPMPVADVEKAGEELAELLEKFSPGARITVHAPA